MEHHESATLMTANDDERVALLLKSGSKRMMTPVSSSFAQKRTAALNDESGIDRVLRLFLRIRIRES